MMDYRIVIGDISDPDFEFSNDNIALDSIHYSTSVDVVGANLSWDEFSAEVYGEVSLLDTPYGTPIYFYRGEALEGKFYVQNIVRVGATRYQINAISGIGLLDNQRHNGGLYTSSDNVTVGSLIADIVGNTFDYAFATGVASEMVIGWLPIASKRDNLHKLTFAMGIAITKDDTGKIIFQYLSDLESSEVPSSRIFMGGDVNYNEKITAAQVVEHSFYALQDTPEVQLFDNMTDVTVSGLRLEFDGPHFGLTATENLTIDEEHVNYAVVSGNGILFGKPYTHNTRTVHRAVPVLVQTEKVVSSDQDTLVNSLNSENVVRRLLAYYSSRKTVKASIKLDGEKAGDQIHFTDPFGDLESGFISRMETSASSFLKASCEIVTDYTPTGRGNYYSNRVMLTENGTWSVPAGVSRIRIVLIGGGSGGCGGWDGEDGAWGVGSSQWQIEGDLERYDEGDMRVLYYPNQPVKQGGPGGDPGSPGKVLVLSDITVSPGELITISVGTGGAGGNHNNGIGAEGGATMAASTSLGQITSATGTSSDAGYYDVFADVTYATVGSVGLSGMPGGQTDDINLDGSNGGSGLPGEDFDETFHGGAGGTGARIPGIFYEHLASGGGGGGAAYGASGGNGGNASITGLPRKIVTGVGGVGASALPPAQAGLGCGGNGGNGGGAGGNVGGGTHGDINSSGASINLGGTEAAKGGKGSVGGQGGDGCVIIYY